MSGTNKSVSGPTGKCPESGCSDACPLADMEGHLRLCSTRSEDKLVPGGTSGHLHQESRSQSEILIWIVASMNEDITVLKRGDKRRAREIDMLKYRLATKGHQISMAVDTIRNVRDEIESIKASNELGKVQNESIKQAREVLSERVRQLSGDRLAREKDESRQSDERGIAMVTATRGEIGSSPEELESEMVPGDGEDIRLADGEDIRLADGEDIRLADGEDIRLVDGDVQSIEEDVVMDCMGCRGQSTRVPVRPVVAVGDDWLIDTDIGRTGWGRGHGGTPDTSAVFRGATRPYTFQLASMNYIPSGELCICLCVRAADSADDPLLQWPFRGAVTVTVADRDRREACCRQTRQCRIGRPPPGGCRCSDLLIFQHTALRAAGLRLECGVRVSCRIELSGGPR